MAAFALPARRGTFSIPPYSLPTRAATRRRKRHPRSARWLMCLVRAQSVPLGRPPKSRASPHRRVGPRRRLPPLRPETVSRTNTSRRNLSAHRTSAPLVSNPIPMSTPIYKPAVLLSGVYDIDCATASDLFGDYNLDLSLSADHSAGSGGPPSAGVHGMAPCS
jgi:hypothetical protein